MRQVEKAETYPVDQGLDCDLPPEELSFVKDVLESLQDEVFVYSCDTLRVRYMNAAARKRVGWNAHDCVGKQISETVATFDIEGFLEKMAPLRDGKTDKVIFDWVHPRGPIEISTKIIRAKGEGDFFLSVLRDLNFRKRLESAKLQTVSTVSHELRTPLTSVHGALRLLRAGTFAHPDENTQTLLDIASRNTDRLLAIVNDILDFEKIKGNRMDFTISEIDIVKCVYDTIELVSGIAAENEVNLEIVTDLQQGMVRGNPDPVAQVITNFASNAIKFSPKGASVSIRITSEDSGVHVSVTDQGPGISEADRNELFKPFSQVSATDGIKRPGTGLGLAIVAAILSRLEYPLDVKTAVGAGSTFAFRIPPHLVIRTSQSGHRKTVSV